MAVCQTVNFLDSWLIGKKNFKFYTYINVIRVQNENCEFLQNLSTDFLVALSVETPGTFTLFSLKQRKFTM